MGVSTRVPAAAGIVCSPCGLAHCSFAGFALLVLCISSLTGCLPPHRFGNPGSTLHRLGDEILICGRLLHTGAPVVLWIDPGGFDAYRVEPRFADTPSPPDTELAATTSSPASRTAAGPRYGSLRRHLTEEDRRAVESRGWDLARLRQYVTQVVLHYDACGSSRRCFEVLHDMRGLSAHFLLDLDGTIYQTLDVKERAWHAGAANDRSIGIEIANIGAFPAVEGSPLPTWYATDASGGTRIVLPPAVRDTLRVADRVWRPCRSAPIRGDIQDARLVQYDLTDAQYDSLAKLVATLCIALPEIRVDYPRDADGVLIRHTLPDDQIRDFRGLVGHFHVSRNKVDPGPAFDWERLLRGVRKCMR